MLASSQPEGYPSSIEETRLETASNGYYEIRWTTRDGNGRARTRTYSCRTKDADVAKAVRDAWWSATYHVSALAPARTVAQLCRTYRDAHLTVRDIKPAQDWSLRPIERELGSCLLADLSGGRLRGYHKTRRSDGVADGTIRRELGALRAVLGWALRSRELPEDTILPHIALPPSGQPRSNYLGESDAERCFDLAAADRWHGRLSRVGRFVCIALETAARSRSIETLEWSAVNFTSGLIDFRTPGERATNKRRGVVPISDKLRPILEQAFAERVGPCVLDGTGSARKGWERFRRQHGFDVTRHDLRRTWASLRAMWGVSMTDIARVLGDSVETTSKHYAHFSPDYLRAAVNAGRGKPKQAA